MTMDETQRPMSHLFAVLARMRFIRRWGLMHNTYPENIQEHSLRVAMIAHLLALIGNRMFDRSYDPNRAAVLALYHDVGEVITGDLPSPVKYFSPEIRQAYQEIESVAGRRLLDMVPEPLRQDFETLLLPDPADDGLWALVKAADKLCAYTKCLEELAAGNREFVSAERSLKAAVQELDMPEARWFVEVFLPSFRLNLDQLSE